MSPTSPTSLDDLHRAQGAAFSQGSTSAGAELLTYGDVPGEYHAARQSAVVFDHTARAAVAVTGPDAESFLHRLLANSVRGLAVGQGNRNLLLSSKGKVRFDFEVAREDSGFTLCMPAGAVPGLLAALETYHFSEKVSFRDASVEHAPLTVFGPEAARVLEKALAWVPATASDDTLHAWRGGPFDSHQVRTTHLPQYGARAWRVDGGPGASAALWRALCEAGARPAGRIVHDILRVEGGCAEFGVDVDENVYPQEARLEEAFCLDKGCYVGQEVVAKIDTYGGLNKRLMALRVSHDDPVAHGTRLWREEDGEWRDLGVVTTWAYSFGLDAGAVLGYVKRQHQDPGTEFRLGAGPARATLVELPLYRPPADNRRGPATNG